MSEHHEPPSRVRPSGWRTIGLLALFSGAALLVHILTGVSLRLSLLVATIGVVAVLTATWRSISASQRLILKRLLSIGAVSGVVATAVYDAAKYVLSLIDGSGFNPFGAIRIFGTLLVGDAASAGSVLGAGVMFHLLNGVLFGVAYVLLFGGRGIWAGIAWGLFLEAFQLTLYPGWLDIEAYREFVTISAMGHVAYGATLGAVSLGMLQGRWRRSPATT